MSNGSLFYHCAHSYSSDFALQSDILSKSSVYETFVHLLTSITNDANSILESLSLCAKKWKDSLKPIIPKLMLLQSTLDGYSLKMSVLEFLFTVASCGMWHPAAQVAFSSQWGEQNLTRLCSTVDSSTRLILRVLVMEVNRLATNIHLKMTDLLRLHSQHMDKADTKHYEQVLRVIEAFQLKLDDCIDEARLARDQMMLFLQFIKDSMEEASGADDSKTPVIDLSQRMKYAQLFDPRMVRCQNELTAQSFPEVLTGTFLFAYLQPGPLPPHLMSSRCSRDSESPMKEVQKLVDRMLSQDSSMEEGDDARLRNLQSLADIAKELCQQIKLTCPTLHSTSFVNLETNVDRSASSEGSHHGSYDFKLLIPSIELLSTNGTKIGLNNGLVQTRILRSASSVDIAILCHALTQEGSPVYGARVESSDVSEVIAVSALYGEGKTPAIVGVALMIDLVSYSLFRISFEDLKFSPIHRLNSAQCGESSDQSFYSFRVEFRCEEDSLRRLPSTTTISWRALDIQSFKSLHVSGPRGVVAVISSSSGLLLIDMDGDAESDDEMET